MDPLNHSQKTSTHNNLCYEFGPYQFNLNERVLKRLGETIALMPKAAEVLAMLVTNAGQLVEKDELLKVIWPDTFVEEANLSQNIFYLRKALGDDRIGPRYIETVTRRGYRFVAKVRVVEVGGNHSSNGFHLSPEPGANHRPVVAVLPFTNVMGNPEVEYLVQGITDNVINNLSRISKLRVMARSAVFRYRTKELDPQQAGRNLGAQAVLVGKINSWPGHNVIAVELVDTATGWQLWGESFDSENKDLLEIQEAITRQIVTSLKVKLSGDEEKRITARYTENAEAYQSYLEGRHHWSRYTRSGIERAIRHFCDAIELDANYALAYAGIIDCYLRLATNYLPPEDDVPAADDEAGYQPENSAGDADPRVKLRFEWDWKGAERELRRAHELQTTYPTAPQWHAAYCLSRDIFRTFLRNRCQGCANEVIGDLLFPGPLFISTLSPNEEVQVLCAVAREQIDIGNYDAGCLMLRNWWSPGKWPNLNGLSSHGAADLLFTTGSLAGCLASTGHLPKGHKHAEELLSGSIGIFEHVGAKRRAAEARIELALSYYRQGIFSVSRNSLLRVLGELESEDSELRSLALIRLGVVERHAGHIADSLTRFEEAYPFLQDGGPILTGRYYHEMGSTLQAIALEEDRPDYVDTSTHHFQRAFYEFAAIGQHRYAAVVENNHGLLLLKLGRFEEAEARLVHARKLFEEFNDVIRASQVDDSLARLYIATNRLDWADLASQRAVSCLEANDEEALLAEALSTRGLLFCKLKRFMEARAILEGASRIAERCSDFEGASRALLILFEEMCSHLDQSDQYYVAARMRGILEHTQTASTRSRLTKCLMIISTEKT
ncbi:MAG TPA: winged helix-turn-helix domain-containing protein [Pyrinomonadaceae bacterium]|nr:winged helix-turn-helix domain-containing protein [Pyrinomonadaceae bacterium]